MGSTRLDRVKRLSDSDPDVQHQVAAGGWAIAISPDAPPSHQTPAAWSDGIVSIHTVPAVPHRFGISFARTARFDIDFSERAIRVQSWGDLSPETFRHLLLDQVFPRILAHEGRLVLHAAGVIVRPGAALFVGPSGSGKSTLAASFHVAGRPLLGDDAVMVTTDAAQVSAQAVYRSLRLFADSVAEILGSSATLTPVADYTSKWNVEQLDGERHDQEVPVRAVFLLDPEPVDEVTVRPVGGAEACMAMVEQSFSLDPSDSRQAGQRLSQASAAAARVPTFRLGYPRDYNQIRTVHEAVVNALG